MSFARELQNLLDEYLRCYAAQDADGCARHYHSGGRIDSPFGPPLEGRDAIRSAHLEWFLEGEENKSLQILSAASDGALGYALLRYSADLPTPYDRPPQQDAGTSLNVIVPAEDGPGWVFLHTSLNSDFTDDNS